MNQGEMTMLDKYSALPRDTTAEMIECYIMENNMKPKDRLPAERRLCEMWHISRNTLRSAIRKLTMEGKVYSLVGSGTYVAPPKFVRKLQDIENLGMKSIVRNSGRKIRTDLLSVSTIECTKQISKRLHVPLGRKIFVLSRLRSIDATPSWTETSYLDYERFPDIEKYNFTEQSLYHIMETVFGVKVIQGKQKISITYTTKEEAELLVIPEETAVFYVSGIACDSAGNPVEYYRSIVRSDQVRFFSVLQQTVKNDMDM